MTRSFDALHIDPFASGAWPLLSLVSDDTRELCPRSGLGFWWPFRSRHWTVGNKGTYGAGGDIDDSSRSCCQFLVGKALANDRNYKAVEAFKRVAFHVSDIQAEGELIHVAMQVLLGNLM